VLRKAGFSVIGVTSTEEALQVLKDSPVCCTIADHMLKGETGTALAKKMKAIKPEVPIVLHSGTVPERLEAVDVYVNKGEPTDTFLSIVHAVVQRYRS
jgi:DNA-binding NtrC family response regulator